MKNRQLVVAALAGVLAGSVIGAGTYFSAQAVSYRYSDRGTFRIIRTQADLHPTRTQPARWSRHTAAGKRDVIPEKCAKFTGGRRTRCIGESRNGADYHEGHE